MVRKKVVHYAKTLGFSGTEKIAQTFSKYLAKGDKYEPFLVFQENGDRSRYDIC